MLRERLRSGAGCSTSYAAGSGPLCGTRRLRGREGARCHAAQHRSYRGAPSPERDPHRRHVSPHRVVGSVAAAAAVAPPSPSREALHHPSLPEGGLIATSIPDAIPSLEDLEDLHNRAMLASRARRAGRSGRAQGGADTPAAAAAAAPPPQTQQQSFDELAAPNSGTAFGVSPEPSAQTLLPPTTARRSQHAHTAPHEPSPQPAAPLPSRPARRGATRSVFAGLSSPPSPPRRAHDAPTRRGAGDGAAQRKQRAIALTRSIKAVVNWRQLPDLLDDLAAAWQHEAAHKAQAQQGQYGMAGLHQQQQGEEGVNGLDPYNAAVLLTHLAQRVAAAQPVSAVELPLVDRVQAAALAVVEQSMHFYWGRQVANMSWALARLGLPSGAAFLRTHLVPAAQPLLPWYEPQHLANTIWALATAGVHPGDAWLSAWLSASFTSLRRSPRSFAPKHLAICLWALEKLGVMPDEEWLGVYLSAVEPAVPAANDQDVSNVLSAAALMALHEHHAPHVAARVTALAAALDARLTHLLAAAGTPNSSSSSSGSGSGGDSGRDSVSDQALANSVWALVSMRRGPSEELWAAAVGAMRQRLADASRPAPGVQTAALPVLLWAGATLGRPLPEAVTSLLYARMRGEHVKGMEPRGVATTVWALAAAPQQQARPPSVWLAEVVAASGALISDMDAQTVSNLLYGLCLLDARPPPAWMSSLINHFHRSAAAEASSQSLSNVLWCMARMGYRLNDQGMVIFGDLVVERLAAWQRRCGMLAQRAALQQQQQQQQMQQQDLPPVLAPPFTSQELSNVLYAFAALGYAPAPELGAALLAAARARLREANAQELSNMAWSLAALQMRPSDAWMADYYTAATARLPTFQPCDLAQSLYGIAKLRAVQSQCVDHAAEQQHEHSGVGAAAAAAGAAAAWLAAALAAAPRLVPASSALDLCNLSWALVQLRAPVPRGSRLAEAFTARLVALASTRSTRSTSSSSSSSGGSDRRAPGGRGSSSAAGGCDAGQLALGVWALGKWRLRPSESQMYTLEVATFRQLPSMRPHELAATLSGFASMSHSPPAEWLEDAVAAVAARSREFGAQDWTVVLHSLSRVRDESMGPHVADVAARLQPCLPRLPLSALMLIAYSCGCMGSAPNARALLARCISLLAPRGAEGDAQAAAAAPAAAGAKPERGYGGGALSGQGRGAAGPAAAAGRSSKAAPATPAAAAGERRVAVASLTPPELCALLWAAVRCGLRPLPAEFRSQFLSHTAPQLASLGPGPVAAFLWAAGRLKMWLPGTWRAALVARLEEVLPAMRDREVVMATAGLTWLRVWPSERLLAVLHARLATASAASARVDGGASSTLARAQGAGGGQGPAAADAVAPRLMRHAEAALRVLRQRVTRETLRRQLHGRRRLWLRRVRAGVAAKGGQAHGGAAGAAAAAVEARVSRRAALVLGVQRRRSSRLAPRKQEEAAAAE